jgi:integrase
MKSKKRKYLARKRDQNDPNIFRVYFRVGKIYIRLPDDELSPEFELAYEDQLATLEGRALPNLRKPNTRKPRELPNTPAVFPIASIGWLIPRYLVSDMWKGYKPGTQKNYRPALDLLRAELGEVLITDLDCERVDHYTATIARKFGGAVADQQKALISNLWEEGKDHAQVKRNGKANPTIDTKVRYRRVKKTKAWAPEAHEQFLATARSTLTLAADVLYFTGQRGGDATKLKWSDLETVVDEETGEPILWLRIVQEKTGTALWHRLPDPLAKRLATEPHISPDYILTNVWKRKWASASVLSHAITRHFRKIGVTGFTMHGLRSAAARDVASLGLGRDSVKSITGHVSDRLADDYASDFDQRRVNNQMVEAWNDDLRRKGRDKAQTAAQAMPPEERRGKLRVVR